MPPTAVGPGERRGECDLIYYFGGWLSLKVQQLAESLESSAKGAPQARFARDFVSRIHLDASDAIQSSRLPTARAERQLSITGYAAVFVSGGMFDFVNFLEGTFQAVLGTADQMTRHGVYGIRDLKLALLGSAIVRERFLDVLRRGEANDCVQFGAGRENIPDDLFGAFAGDCDETLDRLFGQVNAAEGYVDTVLPALISAYFQMRGKDAVRRIMQQVYAQQATANTAQHRVLLHQSDASSAGASRAAVAAESARIDVIDDIMVANFSPLSEEFDICHPVCISKGVTPHRAECDCGGRMVQGGQVGGQKEYVFCKLKGVWVCANCDLTFSDFYAALVHKGMESPCSTPTPTPFIPST
jgi:hypothetical protein